MMNKLCSSIFSGLSSLALKAVLNVCIHLSFSGMFLLVTAALAWQQQRHFEYFLTESFYLTSELTFNHSVTKSLLFSYLPLVLKYGDDRTLDTFHTIG